jgi:predicted N-acyltransferase
MAPFTPATGRRFLLASDGDRRTLVAALLDGVTELLSRERASSAHLLFLSAEECADVSDDPRFLARKTHQFHFYNDGYATFDGFLDRCRSSARKQIRRERRDVASGGLDIRVLTGDEIDDEHVATMERFYRDTCGRKGSYPYLSRSFFTRLGERFRERMVLALAYDGRHPVAGSLSFTKGRCLYGRYWGALADYDKLHFELCFYRLQEWAIARGIARFEAGAQGPHKLRRGFLPYPVYSAHYLAQPQLRAAIGDFLLREAAQTDRVIAALADHGPFHRGEG